MKQGEVAVSLDRVWNERDLMKMLVNLWRAKTSEVPDGPVAGDAEPIKAKLLQTKMQAHEGSSLLERDLWQALYVEELRHSERNGRRFEDSNFRRRIEALGIINAAIENVLLFRTRASSLLKTVSLEAVMLNHKMVFGSHLCDVARRNLELRTLFNNMIDEPDDE